MIVGQNLKNEQKNDGMIKKSTFTLFFIFISTFIFAQDSVFFPKNKIEMCLNYAIQRPFYSMTIPTDIFELPHYTRYRNRIGVGLKYYVLKKWFLEYQTAYSQEGGGFKAQYTNANYWKNNVYVGF